MIAIQLSDLNNLQQIFLLYLIFDFISLNGLNDYEKIKQICDAISENLSDVAKCNIEFFVSF